VPIRLKELTESFQRVFLPRANTCLIGGYEEPVYVPSRDGAPAEIRFTRDYIRSALHEVAHWCIAGEARLGLQDYGYWYRPDGRTPEEQSEFFRFEVRPQALEWVFSRRCGIEFAVSVDNLDGRTSRSELEQFERQVALQREIYESGGMPPRAQVFVDQVLSSSSPPPCREIRRS
jgi:elongation factor P hydroxylase